MVHKQIENKTVVEKNEISFSSYAFNNVMSVIPIMPNASSLLIPSGTTQGERIGNSITTRKLSLKYVLYPMAQDQSINPQPKPQEVMIWIGFLKGAKKTIPTAAEFNHFFQNGSSSSSPYSNLWDTMLPVNTDLFTICKSFRHKVGNAVYTDFTNIKLSNYFSNNDYKLNCVKSVDLTKHINKVLKFDDYSVDCDTGLYMWMTSVNADGSFNGQDSDTIGIKYVLRYDYEDA